MATLNAPYPYIIHTKSFGSDSHNTETISQVSSLGPSNPTWPPKDLKPGLRAHMLCGCQLTTRFVPTLLWKSFTPLNHPPKGKLLSRRHAAKSHCGKELWPINKITARNRKLAFVCGQSTFSTWHLGMKTGLGVTGFCLTNKTIDWLAVHKT